MYYLTQVIKYKIILRNQINYEIDSTKCKYFNRRQISYVYFMTEDDNMPTQHDETQHDKTQHDETQHDKTQHDTRYIFSSIVRSDKCVS